MNRRRYLSLLGVGLLAGCQSGEGPQATETQTQIRTATEAPTETATPMPEPDVVLRTELVEDKESELSYSDDRYITYRVTVVEGQVRGISLYQSMKLETDTRIYDVEFGGGSDTLKEGASTNITFVFNENVSGYSLRSADDDIALNRSH